MSGAARGNGRRGRGERPALVVAATVEAALASPPAAGLRYAEVCAGISAASLAWSQPVTAGGLGWTPIWFSEVEEFPCQVLAYHHPDVPNLGDMTLLEERILSGEVEAPDLLMGGIPCQPFSLSGNRDSLDDKRNLTKAFVELANAIDAVRSSAGKAPAYFLIENVPGIFSVEDNAFGCLLAGLVGLDEPLVPPGTSGWTRAGVVDGPKRCAAWAVRDAQFFGLAQRRERVFVLSRGGAGNWDAADALLPIIPSLRWHPEPRRAPREIAPGLVSRRVGEGDRAEPGAGRGGDARGGAGGERGGVPTNGGVAGPAPTVQTGPAQTGSEPTAFWGNRKGGALDVATAQMSKQQHGDFDTETFLVDRVQPVAGAVPSSGKAAGSATEQDIRGNQCVVVPAMVPDVAHSLTVGANGSAGHQYRQNGSEQNCVVVQVGIGMGGDGTVAGAIGTLTGGSRTTDLDGVGGYALTPAPTQRTFSIIPESGQGADLRASEVEVATAVTTEEAKSIDRGIRIISPAPAQPVAFKPSHYTRGKDGAPSEVAPPFTADADKGDQDAVLMAPTRAEPLAFSMRGRDGENMAEVEEGGVAPAIRSANGGSTRPGVIAPNQQPMPFDPVQITSPDNQSQPAPGQPAHTLCDPGRAAVAIPAGIEWAVRRFTPREVERLFGVPDGYTLIPVGRRKPLEPDFLAYLQAQRPGVPVEDLEKLACDGARYRSLGNSIAVPVLFWIGGSIQRIEDQRRSLEAP